MSGFDRDLDADERLCASLRTLLDDEEWDKAACEAGFYALPAYIAEVRRLRAENAKLRGLLSRCGDLLAVADAGLLAANLGLEVGEALKQDQAAGASPAEGEGGGV